jgi:murein L,D-transpeptidase YcbB/YkuD
LLADVSAEKLYRTLDLDLRAQLLARIQPHLDTARMQGLSKQFSSLEKTIEEVERASAVARMSLSSSAAAAAAAAASAAAASTASPASSFAGAPLAASSQHPMQPYAAGSANEHYVVI